MCPAVVDLDDGFRSPILLSTQTHSRLPSALQTSEYQHPIRQSGSQHLSNASTAPLEAGHRKPRRGKRRKQLSFRES